MSKPDYKDTINLPKTAFAMRANLPNKEPSILKNWQQKDIYQQMRTTKQDQAKFILHDGPPYANGDIHIGHAVNKILKDIVLKSKALSGFDVPYIPGWDCHGLPIELNVEKKHGVANVDLPAKEFRQKCRDYAKSQVELQKFSFTRLGVFADWDNPYLTMSHDYEANIIRALGKIYENGHLHQGAKPVHWCFKCASALAEAEVEYQDKTSPAIDVAFSFVDSKKLLEKFKTSADGLNKVAAVIWTTTPWTLPANQAIAVKDDFDYALVKVPVKDFGFDALVLANDMVEQIMARYKCEEHQVLATVSGSELDKLLCQHPFLERQVPIILGDHVTLDAGTGLVHTAPAHGLDDYLVSLKYNLPCDNPVAGNGCFYEDVPFVGNMHVLKANNTVNQVLKDKSCLIAFAELNHSYPHCWRHKTPLIFRATPQWFVSMTQNNLRETALKATKEVNWIPDWGQSRIDLMMENRPDWCISRQRTWGVPLPLLLHKTSNEPHPDSLEVFSYVADLVEKGGIEAWYSLDINDMPFSDLQNYDKSTDSLDVWFDSGVSHHSVLNANADLHFPADLYLEGSDQHRGWFQSALLSSVAMHGTAPYKTVLTHGFTVDAKGHKMSKSLGNVVKPEKIIKTLGADILRLWVAATDYKNEMHVSDEILKRTADAYRRIRNTLRFLLANLDGFDPAQHLVESDKMLSLDRWIVSEAQNLQEQIKSHYDNYQFHSIYQQIHNFCVVELGSFYLDVIKDRQYTTKTNSVARRSAQTAMYYLAHTITRWMAPILCFTAEEVWAHLPDSNKPDSVFLTNWYQDFPDVASQGEMNKDYWKLVMNVREQVNKALEGQRGQGTIGAPLEAEVSLYVDDKLFTKLKLLEDELRFVLITSKASLLPIQAKPQQALKTDIAGLFVKVEKAPYEKCQRCWHRVADVDADQEYPELCSRCVINIKTEQGEIRKYA